EFQIIYQIHNYERFQANKIEELVVEHPGYELVVKAIMAKSPTRQEIILPRRRSESLVPYPSIPSLAPLPRYKHFLWPVAVPLVLYVLWLLLKRGKRLILQRRRTDRVPQLQQYELQCDYVKLFDTPPFRRVMVELRRHRQVEANDLDITATVQATIRQ